MSSLTERVKARLERLDRLTELIAVFILSVAALFSSYASFQAQLWDGEQAASYALAEQARTDSSMRATVAAEVRTLDLLQFTQWTNAYAVRNRPLQQFYRSRFRPVFARAFEEWLATDPANNPKAPLSPLEMGSYARSADSEARMFRRKADSEFARGEHANHVSDGFGRGTVILALTLFLGGVVQAFKGQAMRMVLLSIATACCLLGIFRVMELPALRITL
jgi:hypothetical protein